MSASRPPVVRRLTSANDEFQLLLALVANRQKRHQRGEFVVQGVKPINAAVRTGWPLRAVITADGAPLSKWAASTLEQATVETHYVLAPGLFVQLAEREEPGELLAVATTPPRTLGDIDAHQAMVVCVFDRLQSPGNLGSIIRSADAFGADAVVLLGHTADPYDPQAVRASTGSVFSIPVVSVPSTTALANWIGEVRQQVPARVIGADEKGPPLQRGALRAPIVMLFGAEATGLSRGARELCDELIALPSGGVATSLNVANAASIFLFESRS